MQLLKDNYMRGSGNGSLWNVDIDPPLRRVRTYYEETVECVEQIYANKTGKLHLLYSGGQDSEYLFRIFKKLGLDFEVVLILLRGPDSIIYNEHEIKYAFDFCEAYNVTPIIYDLNFHEFIDSGLNVEIARSIECCYRSLPGTLHVVSQIDGFTVLGNDPPYIRYKDDAWYLEETEGIHSILRYYKKHNIPGCPFLLSWSAEMMLSFLIDPTIMELGSNRLPGKTGSNSSKAHAFNNGSGFEMEPYDFVSKKRIKNTGYEKIYGSELANHPNLKIFIEDFEKKWNGEYREKYSDVVERLSIHQ